MYAFANLLASSSPTFLSHNSTGNVRKLPKTTTKSGSEILTLISSCHVMTSRDYEHLLWRRFPAKNRTSGATDVGCMNCQCQHSCSGVKMGLHGYLWQISGKLLALMTCKVIAGIIKNCLIQLKCNHHCLNGNYFDCTYGISDDSSELNFNHPWLAWGMTMSFNWISMTWGTCHIKDQTYVWSQDL